MTTLYINGEHCLTLEQLKGYFAQQDLTAKSDTYNDLLEAGKYGDLEQWLQEHNESALAEQVAQINKDITDSDSNYFVALKTCITGEQSAPIVKPSFDQCFELINVDSSIIENTAMITINFKIKAYHNETYRMTIKGDDIENTQIINFSNLHINQIGTIKVTLPQKLVGELLIYIDCEQIYSSWTCDNHRYVDLGLPSGTKWADCNIGAQNPSEEGDYFAWGEIEPKTCYTWETFKYCSDADGKSIKKYFPTDSKLTLEPEDDAAHVLWGEHWNMPSPEQIIELKNNCKWTQETIEGKEYFVGTGPNGNSIYFVKTGMCYEESKDDVLEKWYYWSSWLRQENKAFFMELDYSSFSMNLPSTFRFLGLPIRPVVAIIH